MKRYEHFARAGFRGWKHVNLEDRRRTEMIDCRRSHVTLFLRRTTRARTLTPVPGGFWKLRSFRQCDLVLEHDYLAFFSSAQMCGTIHRIIQNNNISSLREMRREETLG
jgi:hypothetical protein